MADPNESRALARRKALGRAINRHRAPETQIEMAAGLGVSQAVVSMWEAGTVEVPLHRIEALEDYLGLASGTLLVESGYIDQSLIGDSGTLLLAVGRLEEVVTHLRTIQSADSDEDPAS